MAFYENNVHPLLPSGRHADCCDDQLPLISRVGRGMKGDSARVKITDPDSCTETHLEGGYWDEGDKTWHTDWISENINGGELKYQYNLRPYTIPRTFTITFIYKRPGRHEWSWTTPAIPYIWTLDPAGKPDENPDHVVGSGVATLFCRTVHEAPWNIARDERLWYPIDPDTGEPYPREDFNPPDPEAGWSATVTFGFKGDVDVPDFDDLAKFIGYPDKSYIYDILENNPVTFHGITHSNLIEYIDKCDDRDLAHIHADLGFGTSGRDPHTGQFGDDVHGYANNVKEYIDKRFNDLNFDFDINNTLITENVNLPIFNNTRPQTWLNQFNGHTCGQASVTYGYSKEMRLCQIRIDYKANGSIPLPFGIGCDNDYVIATLPKLIRPTRQLRIQLDVMAGGAQTLWAHIDPDGKVRLFATHDMNLAELLISARNAINHPQGGGSFASDDFIWNVAFGAPAWDCSSVISYFYSMKG